MKRKSKNITSIMHLCVGLSLCCGITEVQATSDKNAAGTPNYVSATAQQTKKITGIITDANGEPIIGANVVEKGTTNGVISGLDGSFMLEVPGNAVIEISYIGYTPQTIALKGQTTLNVTLTEDTQKIDEVVVTALGIKRQARSLGYSTTQVEGDDFTMARDPNIGNALSGKIAGVSVSGNATGTGGSSRVVIRGNASLTGNNQPLYVVDGVPFDNTNMSSAGQYGGLDLGDGLSNINADDIESIQVLKGAAASALYGYRGGNGAILITTKSGKKNQPVSIDFNNNLTFNTIYDYRDFQNVFGQGSEGQRPLTVDAAKATETLSWGEPMDGGKAVNFLGNEYTYSPVNNWDSFYRTGINNTTSLSLSGGGEKITYRFGVSNMAEKGILPNAHINQQALNMNTTYDILKNLHLTVNANYVFEKNQGRASLSDGNGSTNASLLYRANTFDINWLQRENENCDWGTSADGKELIGGTNVYFNNPYFLQYRKVNTTNKNRLTGGITLKYDIFDWLYVQGAVTRDGYSFEYRNVQPYGAAADASGYLDEYEKNFSEMNLNYLIGFNKEFGDWSIGATLGGNRQRNILKQWGTDGNIKGFLFPGFEGANSVSNRLYKKDYTEYRVNSVYATADFGWKNQLFLNLTGRNDWFSTLNPNNNSYFYPSATLSWVFTDSIEMPEWFTFGKIRGSYASASNGTDPYQNYLTYKIQSYKINGNSTATVNNSSLPNTNLKPVRISEWEVGLNVAFFNNRLSLDAAYYTKNTKDDIAQVSISNASGFSSAIMNVGEIQNNGVEVMLNGVPVHTKDFQWNSTFNIAYNNSEVKYLGEGVKNLTINGAIARSGNVSVQNIVGQPYGELVGFKYLRDENGNIVHKDGIPQATSETYSLGSGVYKLTGGWRNEFSYKDWTLSFLLDFKVGAKLFSGTNYNLYSNGLHKNTLEGRGSDGKGTIVGDGVKLDANGKYVQNDVAVTAQSYWQGIVNNNIGEEFIYNANFLKLRELSLGYTFPKAFLAKQNVIKGITLSLVGRNLWTIIKHTDNIDPESAYNNGNGQGLELNGYPATRSVGFNVNVKF
ncbi:TonB-dependent receptor [uncultured Parabacteroides sp.]|uniref:SusC/RagA family TonB-linked outer membrane protein n=1 Tax=uncultured Parabacteroides sp. TaxID=512312 RepID=UPI002633DB68|nr:TonB-dependent receptor [uncultured Parabacteroides sp.]